jgi:hypothetical protein
MRSDRIMPGQSHGAAAEIDKTPEHGEWTYINHGRSSYAGKRNKPRRGDLFIETMRE